MKKLLLIAALTCTTAFAGGHYQQPQRHHYNGGANWIVPALVGGLIVYGATRPETVVVQPPPQTIYVQPVAPVYAPRNEYNEPPLTDRRPPEVYYAPAPQYIERTLYDQSCSCYRKFLQQIN